MDVSKIVAMDCEMVGTGLFGSQSELARCSIVDYHGNVLYDKFVKPEGVITDYRTPVSGIHPSHMETAVPFCTARKEILDILQGNLVVGHALHNDFEVLKENMAKYNIWDTATDRTLRRIGNLEGYRRVSLKVLCERILKKNIQTSRHGHSSVEDANATIELFKVCEKINKMSGKGTL